MPYIAPKDRDRFDLLINELVKRIKIEADDYGYDGAFAGLCNYTCLNIVLKVVRLQFGKFRYWMSPIIRGIFFDMALEFYNRVVTPYEKKQIKKNGDLPIFQEFLEEIENGK